MGDFHPYKKKGTFLELLKSAKSKPHINCTYHIYCTYTENHTYITHIKYFGFYIWNVK